MFTMGKVLFRRESTEGESTEKNTASVAVENEKSA